MIQGFSPLLIVRPALWLAVVVVATILLRRRKVTPGVRLSFIVGGVLVFGFLFAQTAGVGLQPNPVAALRTVLGRMFIQGPGGVAGSPMLTILPAVVLLILLGAGWVSNKAICGWVCPFGLLQDLFHRVPLPKCRPSFRLTNTVRAGAFVALVVGLVVAGFDWIEKADPFSLFSLNLTQWAIALVAVVLIAALFVYRPWCRFLCPFGLVSWLLEQVSVLRPRIDREACKECKVCVKACPTTAMADIYDGKKLHADCFACGACIAACPQKEALQWRK
ncbi:MAG: 4Fe-4S binding protein [Dehalococcoidia bacterium]|nr:4Fe-4S binding protein [Dehalococcoidia bacterium]